MLRIRAVFFLGAATLFQACGASAPVSEPLNVILISLDTMRADRLGYYRDDRPLTPNLDRLAQESIAFTNTVSQSTATAASHMSLFTGQYVHRHGLAHNFDARFPRTTLASVLRDRGWRTAGFTGHGSLKGGRGYDAGFEIFESEPSADLDSRNFPEAAPEALQWIDQHGEEPFFLFVHGYDPHCPYAPPEPWGSELRERYSGAIEMQEACGMRTWGPLIESGAFGEPERQHLIELYDAELAAADDAIGRFLDALRERGVLDRSILVFTSDHGEVLGDHDWIGHTRLWEEEIRVPLLIRFPEGRFTTRVSDPVQHIDVMPTLLSALGVDIPPGVQGVDLMPRIRGEEASVPRDRMRLTQIRKRIAVRFDDRWKLVLGPDSRGVAGHQPKGAQIYDLESDPGEDENLYDTPEGRRRYDEIWERYRRWLRDTRDEDARFRASKRPLADDEEHRRMLESLGYIDDGKN